MKRKKHLEENGSVAAMLQCGIAGESGDVAKMRVARLNKKHEAAN